MIVEEVDAHYYSIVASHRCNCKLGSRCWLDPQVPPNFTLSICIAKPLLIIAASQHHCAASAGWHTKPALGARKCAQRAAISLAVVVAAAFSTHDVAPD